MLGQKSEIIMDPDFALSLKKRGILKKFHTYLEKNRDFLKTTPLRSIHFDSTNDWLDGLRNKNGTRFYPK
jgi:hypothetical protein